MRTYNIDYCDKSSIESFLSEVNHTNYSSILVQAFTSIYETNFIKQLQNDIKSLLPNSKMIGATVKNISTTNSHTTLSITYFENTTIDTSITSGKECNFDNKELGKVLLTDILQSDTKVVIIYAGGSSINGDDFTLGISDIINKSCSNNDIIISGGLSSDNQSDKTYCFTNDKICDFMSAVAVSLNSNTLNANNKLTFDWEGIGTTMKVTKSDKNRLFTIDNKTAFDTYKYYFGEDLANSLPNASIEFPIILKETSRAKIVLEKCDDGSLILGGNVQDGDLIQFGFGNAEVVLNSSVKLANDITNIPAESIFMFSCDIRKTFLNTTFTKEIELYSEIAPTSGFFTLGEFYTNTSSNEKNKYEFVNQSLTLLILSESKATKPIELQSLRERNRDKQTIKALSHLIDMTSQELLNTNKQLIEKQKKLKDLNNNLTHLVEIERKKILQQNKQLLEQSRLAQMGEMISMIAHQWRQPLSAISSTSSTLSLKIKLNKYDSQVFVENVDKITKYAQHLSKTIDDFRNFFKTNKEKDNSTLEDIINSSLGIVQISLENKNIKLITDFNSNKTFATYTNEIKQVVLNLLKNAEDVLLERDISNPTITVNTRHTENNYIIEIEDNAGGIDDVIINKIFDPYFSTKKAKDGTGLGLYMSKTIIEDHCNGKLLVCNNDKGASFQIII